MSAHSMSLSQPVRDYLLRVGVREAPVLARLREETAPMAAAQMQICPEQGALMGLLVQISGARRILEVGTFTGYSSLAMALAMPDDGTMVCCDVSEEFTSLARKYWAEAGVADRIDLRIAPALDTLDALIADGQSGTFDLCFVDADKGNYSAYHERCLQLAKPGGVLLYDNVLWGGSAADPTDDRDSTRAIQALNDTLSTDERVDLVMIPIGDGLTMARKRG